MSIYKHSIIRALTPIAIFLTFLTIGVFTLDDHGLSWDEGQQRIIGETNYNYVFRNDSSLLSFNDKDYGVAFELPLMIIEKSFDFKDTRDIYLMRHFLTHLLFLVSGVFLYFLILKLTKNRWISIVGFLMLLLNPRIYAHSFFNTKDIPFLSFLIICFYLVFTAFENKTFLKFLLLGAASALLINLRIIGILLPIIVISFLIIDAFKNHSSKRYSFHLAGIYLISTFLILWLTWPYLWPNPFLNFKTAFINMAHFRLNIIALFQGELINIYDLPKSYAFVWIGITTPLFFLFSIIIGFIVLLYHIIRFPLSFILNKLTRQYLIYFAFLSAPFAAIYLLDSVIYDGWRQLYFIYPCLILMTVFGLEKLLSFAKKLKFFIYPLFAITFASLVIFMIKSAPNQQVYFNEVFSNKEASYLRKNYELDYWGASYLTALEYILERDQSEEVKIAVNDWPGTLNVSLLNSEDRARVKIIELDSATYLISNYRWNSAGYPNYQDKIFHTIMVQGNEITTIFKLK